MTRRHSKALAACYYSIVGMAFLGVWAFPFVPSARPGWSQSESTAPKLVLHDGTRDVGTVSQGEVVGVRFRVANTGSRRLLLREEAKGCCGQPTHPRGIQVPPGGSTWLDVEVDTAPWYGRMEHIVYYRTNDPRMPRFGVTVTGLVE